MATTSGTSISGVATGVDTTSLINAIIAQKGTNLTRLQARRDLNDKKTAALTALRTSLTALNVSLAVIQDKFNNRTVSSTDINSTNVTATASGALADTYDISVKTVATKGRISATLDSNGWTTNLAVASPTDSVNSGIFTAGTPASFAIQGTDGVIKTITLDASSNTLNGLRDKINASGAGVTASVVNMGKGDKPYQLVLTAKATGTGVTQGVVTLVDITDPVPTDPATGLPVATNSLGIAAGTVDLVAKTLTGGLTSSVAGTATDADFTLNGIELTRSTNVVKDAAEGMTFTLKQGGQTGTTTLTVGLDKAGATAAMADFISKYNLLLKDYKAASTSTKNADGSVNQAALAGDTATIALMSALKARLAGASAGLPGTATYQSLASVGISNMADGSLYLNTNAFQTAMANDLGSVQKLFNFSGISTNQGVTFKSAGPKTATGPVDVTITKDTSGTLWGTLTRNNVVSAPIQVTNGILIATGDLEGLNLTVTDTGSGTLTLSRGAGQAGSDLLSTFTGVGGGITTGLNTIFAQNKNLATQITQAQTMLDREKEVLKQKFAKMEAAVGAMKASAGSLIGA